MMKEFFARLNPMERRFVVGVGVAFFVVLNAVLVFPLFGKWSDTRKAMNDAHDRVFKFSLCPNQMLHDPAHATGGRAADGRIQRKVMRNLNY